MPKKESKIEIYFAFHAGLKPADLIARGLPKNTVYAYSYRYKKREYSKKFRELMAMPIKEKGAKKK